MAFDIYYYWLIMAIVLIIVEIVTAGFGAVCFAMGALCSAVAAYIKLSFSWQLGIFAIISLVAFIFLRPIALKFLEKKSQSVKTNADALIGKTAIVSETINCNTHTGRVTIDGDSWKAVSNDNSIIEKGKEVEITEINSIILTVKMK